VPTSTSVFAVDGAKRMQVLINDLLAFSRVGRLTGDRQPVAVGALVDQAEANLADALARTGATVEVGELPMVLAEAPLLTAVFQNLLSNALKFHGDHPPHVTIAARRDGPDWEFSFADTGIGIGAEYGERIFIIFQRLHPKDEYPGTGIGLAMCRKIIEYHGGRIWLDNSAAVGSRFLFTLPRYPRTPPTRTQKMTDAFLDVIDILLVEDDEGDVLMTREAFEHHKIRNRLHVVNDGEKALQFLRRQAPYGDVPRPGLILLDLNLPARTALRYSRT